MNDYQPDPGDRKPDKTPPDRSDDSYAAEDWEWTWRGWRPRQSPLPSEWAKMKKPEPVESKPCQYYASCGKCDYNVPGCRIKNGFGWFQEDRFTSVDMVSGKTR